MGRRQRRIEKERIKRTALIKRSIKIFLAFALVGMFILSSGETYSYFTSRAAASVDMSIVNTSELLDYEIIGQDYIYDENINVKRVENPYEIVIKKANTLSCDPLIYFSVEGEASKFISHINPIRLKLDSNNILHLNDENSECFDFGMLYFNENDDTFHIPIRISMNLKNLSLSILNVCGEIDGTIGIKYLNEFIDEKQEIEFTKDYIINQFNRPSNLVSNKEKYIDYSDEESSLHNIAAANDVDFNDGFNSISKMDLTKEQKEIIDAISPNFLFKVKGTINKLNNTTIKLNEAANELNIKIKQVNELEDKLSELQIENKDLNNKVGELIGKDTSTGAAISVGEETNNSSVFN